MNRNVFRIFPVVLLFSLFNFVFVSVSNAQETTIDPTIDEFADIVIKCIVENKFTFTELQTNPNNIKIKNCLKTKGIKYDKIKAEKNAQINELIQKYEYEKWIIEHQQLLYKTQYWTGLALLVVSIVAFGCGLKFSYLQFKTALEISKISAQGELQNKQDESIDKESTINTVKIGATGIEISTSIIGLIILVISIVFFYFYLDKIYPITDSQGKTTNKIPQSLFQPPDKNSDTQNNKEQSMNNVESNN